MAEWLRRDRGLTVTVVLLALLVCTPLLMPGFVLSRDMVFVPHQPMTWASIGAGDGLPRAVPVDAVVSVLSLAVSGDVLQKVVLVSLLVAAGLGAGRLAGSLARQTEVPEAVARVAAAACYLWNPYVAERLLIGHWSLLVGYAVLPWLVSACLRPVQGRRGWAGVLLRAALAALTPTGGVLAGIVVLSCCARRWVPAVVVAVLINLPWVVPGLLNPASGSSDADGVAAFALRPESWAGPVGAALGLGGLWNAEVVPSSRAGAWAPGISLLMAAAAGVGALALRGHAGAALDRLAVLWLLGTALALAPVWPPTASVVRQAVLHVPGAGLVRDSQKWLALAAVPLAVLAGVGMAAACRWVERRFGGVDPALRASAAAVGVMCAVLTVPDLAWGAAGRLKPVDYPRDWRTAERVLAAQPNDGSVLTLPFQPMRSFPWNGSRVQLDPAPRWFGREVVADNRLTIGATTLDAEGRRDSHVRQALAGPDPGAALRAAGIRWVLVARTTPGQEPGLLAGAAVVLDGPELRLLRLDGPVAAPRASGPRRATVLVVDLLLVAALALAGATMFRRPRWYGTAHMRHHHLRGTS